MTAHYYGKFNCHIMTAHYYGKFNCHIMTAHYYGTTLYLVSHYTILEHFILQCPFYMC